MPRRPLISLSFALMLFASPARAQQPPRPMRLSYTAAEGCPREQVLRDAIDTQTHTFADFHVAAR
jgi:hypothetical protein